MQWFELRPTFEIPLHDTRDEAIERLKAECKRIGDSSRFRMHGEYGELHLPAEEHRLWSPHLSFYIACRQEKECVLHGRFAPRMKVWTFIWFLYLVMAFSAFFGLVFAYVQRSLGHPVWGLWVTAVALVAILCVYIVAHLGQQLSADQMHKLRGHLEEVINASDVTRSN